MESKEVSNRYELNEAASSDIIHSPEVNGGMVVHDGSV